MAPKNEQSSEFLFINNADEESSVRTLIRKQAMKQVAQTRRSKGYQKNRNVRQLPLFQPYVADTETGREDSAIGTQETTQADGALVPMHGWHDALTSRHGSTDPFPRIPPPAPPDNYQRLLMTYDVDPRSLCRLTSVELGRATNLILVQNPQKAILLLGASRDSYISYLPVRYGHTQCLTDAMDAVMSRMRSLLRFGEVGEARKSLLAYSRALRSLQRALEEPGQCMSADILCACQMLSLYELLNYNRENPCAWVQHANGAAKLIRVRGPKRFKTEFEKDLLSSFAGPIISEAALNNEPCFLSQPQWIDVLKSLITNESTRLERSTPVISLLMYISPIPGFLKDFTSLICSSHKRRTESQSTHDILTLRGRAQNLLSTLRTWHATQFAALSETFKSTPHAVSNVLTLFCSFSILLCRCLASIAGRFAPEASTYELQCLSLGKAILRIQQETAHISSNELLLAQKVRVAKATIATSSSWMALHSQTADDKEPGDKKAVLLIGKKEYERWCRFWGRIDLACLGHGTSWDGQEVDMSPKAREAVMSDYKRTMQSYWAGTFGD